MQYDNNGYLMVRFEGHCQTCKYWETADFEDPCDDCLENADNLFSHKPTRYEKKEDKK